MNNTVMITSAAEGYDSSTLPDGMLSGVAMVTAGESETKTTASGGTRLKNTQMLRPNSPTYTMP